MFQICLRREKHGKTSIAWTSCISKLTWPYMYIPYIPHHLNATIGDRVVLLVVDCVFVIFFPVFLSLQSFLPFSPFTRCTCFLNSLDQVLDLNSTIFQGLVIRDSRDRELISLGLWKDSQETHGSRLNIGQHNHGKHHCWLVVWNMNFIFPCIGNVIIPTVTHSIIFQRGWNR